MKKITALLLALLLRSRSAPWAQQQMRPSPLCSEPADDTLLTAEGLALFFVDRAAVKEETETSVSWYKETTANGKTERELIEEMPLVIRPGKGRSATRIYVADGYEPTQELIDAVEKYAPEKGPGQRARLPLAPRIQSGLLVARPALRHLPRLLRH